MIISFPHNFALGIKFDQIKCFLYFLPRSKRHQIGSFDQKIIFTHSEQGSKFDENIIFTHWEQGSKFDENIIFKNTFDRVPN